MNYRSPTARAHKRMLTDLESRAAEAAALLKALSNEHRLLMLCLLSSEGELTAGALSERVGLSQSALSQHLGRLREEGLVAYRRQSQTLYYRLADARAARVLKLLHEMYCVEGAAGSRRVSRSRGS
jgi:ArsR family transcriptional regulator, virulence genes transcriptional regulator